MYLEFWSTMYIPKSRMCTTFILSLTAFASQDGLVIPSRSIKKIAAVCAEHKRPDCRHFGKQVGGICLDLSLNLKLVSQKSKLFCRLLPPNSLSLVLPLIR